MAKQVKSAAQLDDLISQQFFAVREVADDVASDPRNGIQPGNAYWHERDEQGCNWNVRGGANLAGHGGALIAIVIDLRQKYDIQEKV